MTITREQMVKKLAAKAGYYEKDVRRLLNHLDETVFEELSAVEEDNDVVIQLVQGIKISVHVDPPRERVDPRNGTPIVCEATVKPAAKFSDDFRAKIQKQYEEKQDG